MERVLVGSSEGLDTNCVYRVSGWPGVAFSLLGYAAREVVPELESGWPDPEGEPELVDQRGRVVVVMVGDDKRHVVDVEDLVPLSETEFCDGCGQIGCGHGSRRLSSVSEEG